MLDILFRIKYFTMWKHRASFSDWFQQTLEKNWEKTFSWLERKTTSLIHSRSQHWNNPLLCLHCFVARVYFVTRHRIEHVLITARIIFQLVVALFVFSLNLHLFKLTFESSKLWMKSLRKTLCMTWVQHCYLNTNDFGCCFIQKLAIHKLDVNNLWFSLTVNVRIVISHEGNIAKDTQPDFLLQMFRNSVSFGDNINI